MTSSPLAYPVATSSGERRQAREGRRWVLRCATSVAISVDDDAEQLGDRIRRALRERADDLEAVSILSETRYSDLPPRARERLGMNEAQKIVLVGLVIRPMDRPLTDAEGNRMRDDVYEAIHQGSVGQWAGR